MAGDKKTEAENPEKKFSRRAFVVGGGTVLAGGALTAVSGATATAAQNAPKTLSTIPAKYLVYDSALRRLPQLHDGLLDGARGRDQPVMARIQVHRAFNKYRWTS